MRLASRQDVDHIIKLEDLLFPKNNFNERTIGHELELGECWLVEVGDDIVGYLLCRDDGHVIDVLRIGVHPNHQGNGIGTSLLSKVLTRQKPVMLTVRKENVDALRLYFRMGFEIVGHLPHDGGWVMLKAF